MLPRGSAGLLAAAAVWVLALMEGVSGAVERMRELAAWLLPHANLETLVLAGRRFQLLRVLGEGGYAHVYLARELDTACEEYAIKRIRAATSEKLTAAAHEAEMHNKLHHQGIVQLLAYEVHPGTSRATSLGPAGMRPSGYVEGCEKFVSLSVDAGDEELQGAEVLLLLPLYRGGTLASEVERLHAVQQRLAPRHVASLFAQLCGALAYLHDEQGIAHRDVKPYNLLLTSAATNAGVDSDDVVGGGSGGSGVGIAEPTAMLMDFGSAGPRSTLPATRREALHLQELAEAHCTATYRPPELFDVPTGRVLDYAAADVWGAGCTLFAAMYGVSPFQRAVDERDGSLALAVLSCQVRWPREGEPQYPVQLHELVTVCLALDPAQRPTAGELQRRATELLRAGL